MVVVEHVPSDIDRIILVSTSRRHSRVVDLPSFNSEGSDVTIEILPAKPGSGLQMNVDRDEYTPTYDDIYESVFGKPMQHNVRVQLNTDEGDDSDKGDVPSYEHIRKAVLGR